MHSLAHTQFVASTRRSLQWRQRSVRSNGYEKPTKTALRVRRGWANSTALAATRAISSTVSASPRCLTPPASSWDPRTTCPPGSRRTFTPGDVLRRRRHGSEPPGASGGSRRAAAGVVADRRPRRAPSLPALAGDPRRRRRVRPASRRSRQCRCWIRRAPSSLLRRQRRCHRRTGR